MAVAPPDRREVRRKRALALFEEYSWRIIPEAGISLGSGVVAWNVAQIYAIKQVSGAVPASVCRRLLFGMLMVSINTSASAIRVLIESHIRKNPRQCATCIKKPWRRYQRELFFFAAVMVVGTGLVGILGVSITLVVCVSILAALLTWCFTVPFIIPAGLLCYYVLKRCKQRSGQGENYHSGDHPADSGDDPSGNCDTNSKEGETGSNDLLSGKETTSEHPYGEHSSICPDSRVSPESKTGSTGPIPDEKPIQLGTSVLPTSSEEADVDHSRHPILKLVHNPSAPQYQLLQNFQD